VNHKIAFGEGKMNKRAAGILIAALGSLASANAQVVPVGAVGQHLVARFFGGINCTTGAQTGFGTAALYLPYIAGIPKAYLFKPGATVFNETTAVLTGVFGNVALSQVQNFNVTLTYLAPQTVSYYYHPNSSPADWTDFDGFQAGTLVATYQVGVDQFTTINGVSLGIVTGPFTFSKDFVLPDGTFTNLEKLMPGGGTFTTMAALGSFVTTASGAPQVVNLTTSKGPFALGSCAVMFPFAGTGTNPGTPTKKSGKNDKVGGEDKVGDSPESTQ
jgi:hypothetical protein